MKTCQTGGVHVQTFAVGSKIQLSIPRKGDVILVIGGSGTLGRVITLNLLAAGQTVRVMTRTPAKAKSLLDAGAEVVTGDLIDRESLTRACDGTEQVIAAAHSFFGRGQHASEHVDRAGHKQLIEVAKSKGVRHFVYTSAYFTDPVFLRIPFVRIKQDVEKHLRASGLNYTILRPTAFMDFHAHVLIGMPVITGKKVMLFGAGKRLRNFVAASDVAQLALRALHDSSLANQTLDIGGPQNLSSIDVVGIYERITGRKAKVAHLPTSVPSTLSRIVRPFHSGVSQMLQMASLADVAEQRFDARGLQERFALRLTRLEDWARRNVQQH